MGEVIAHGLTALTFWNPSLAACVHKNRRVRRPTWILLSSECDKQRISRKADSEQNPIPQPDSNGQIDHSSKTGAMDTNPQHMAGKPSLAPPGRKEPQSVKSCKRLQSARKRFPKKIGIVLARVSQT